MQEMSVVCVFDDPMPEDRDSEIQEMILLRTSNLILTLNGSLRYYNLWVGSIPLLDPDTGEALGFQRNCQIIECSGRSRCLHADPFAAGAAAGSDLSAFDTAIPALQPPAGNVAAPGASAGKTNCWTAWIVVS